MLKSFIIIIFMVAGLFAKNPNDVIKAENNTVNIQTNQQKEAEAYLLSKERDAKSLLGNDISLEQKEYEAIIMQKKSASRKINQKFNQYIDYLNTIEDEIAEESRCEDCMGNDCSAVEDWIGDGICDNGTWDIYFNCDAFECDGGDCLLEDGSCASNMDNGDDGGGNDDGGDSGDDGGDQDCGDIGGTNLEWVGDGYCDGINNFEACDFDGGDCCESTCEPSDYDCSETDGDHGPCSQDVCIDPNGNNDGCEDSSDDGDSGDDGGDDDPGTGGNECADGTVEDCSGDGDCCDAGWIGDGYADCEDQNWGCDLTCYDNDGGDCSEGTGGDDSGGYECQDLGQDMCYMLEGCIWTEDGCVVDDGNNGECEEGTITDCSNDGDCCPEGWINDGICDDGEQYGCDLTCYEGELSDCEGNDDGGDDWGDDGDDWGDDGNNGGECGDDQVLDCSGDGDCCSAGWIGDGYADCEDQAWGCDLTCYDNDGGDCEDNGTGGNQDCEFYPEYVHTEPSECIEDADGNFTNGISMSWEGGCEATHLQWTSPDGETGVVELAGYGFTEGFSLYGLGPNEHYGLTIFFGSEANYVSFEGFSGEYDCSEGGGDSGDDGPYECEDGYVEDCSGDGDCCPHNWIGDGYPDCEDQAYECDLTCYENDGGDCEDNGDGGDDGFNCNDLGHEACNWHEGCVWTEEGCVEHNGGSDDGGGDPVGWMILESSNGSAGGTTEVQLHMESTIAVAGFQFTVTDYPNLLNGVEFASALDSDCWTANSNDVDGSLLGLVFSLNGCVIEPMESSIHLGSLVYEISADAEFGHSIELGFTQLIVSDVAGNAAEFEGIGAVVTIGMPGDVNGDGDLNVLDVVMIVNFILEPGSATEAHYASGDFNSDGELNVLDVVSVVNSILSEDGLSKALMDTPEAILRDNILILNGGIGGIQVDGKIISQIKGSDQLFENDFRTVLINLDGNLETTEIQFEENPMNLIISDVEGEQVSVEFLDQFSLNPVYPNPFNPETRISYTLYKDGIINIGVYDIQGQLIDQLLDESQLKGNYEFSWNADKFSSGIYFLKVISGNQIQTEKLVLIK